jgi:hypothetical protein
MNPFVYRVTKEVEKDSKEAKQFLKKQEQKQSSEPAAAASSSSSFQATNKRPAGGLSSLMGVISGKTPKMGCLDKSKMDWNTFVSEQGIKEDLQSHNRGKDG